jgi:hypothetical protein
MNKNSNYATLLSLLCFLFFVSCKNNDDTSSMIQAQIQANVKSGSWRVTKFIDSRVEETTHFSGYNFIFNGSGIINANNGINDYSGTWVITDSNTSDDTQNDLNFVINFNLTNDFLDLNDDWDFITQSSTKIELIDISGGNGGIDYLTFEKN